jgi:hypothetical protein
MYHLDANVTHCEPLSQHWSAGTQRNREILCWFSPFAGRDMNQDPSEREARMLSTATRRSDKELRKLPTEELHNLNSPQSRCSDELLAGRPEFDSWQGQEFFLLSTSSRPVLGPTQPGVKRPGREADHPPLSSAEVKNGGAIPPLPHTYSWLGA